MKTRVFIRFAIGGQLLGSRMDDDNGQPLTLRTARPIVRRENRKAKLLNRQHEFWVDVR